MTKSKGFWAMLALISLAVVVFSGYSLYTRLTLHFSDDTLQMGRGSVPPLPVPKEPEKPSATGTETARPQATPPPSADPVKQVKPRALKTRFEYKNSSAKYVTLAGSFTSWKEVSLTETNGVWKTDLYILPGSYLFHFLVDGEKTPDPTKPISPLGESIVTVGNADSQN